MLLLFVGFYVAYLSVICIWSILGAILNPEKFLPIAVGAIVILGVIVFMYFKLSNINKVVKEIVDETVKEELKISLFEMIKKQDTSSDSMMSNNNNLSQVMFHRSINKFMQDNDLPNVEKSLTDEILQGNAGAISTLMHEN